MLKQKIYNGSSLFSCLLITVKCPYPAEVKPSLGEIEQKCDDLKSFTETDFRGNGEQICLNGNDKKVFLYLNEVTTFILYETT